jgi:predicted nucleic acid-binding Zn ribbon protein
MRNCLYCGAPIPDDRHKNAWTCTKEHAMLLKKEREAKNYQKVRNTADPIIRLREHFNNLADEFGYELPIDLNFVSPFKIDWSLKTGTFLKDGVLGVALGDIGYIIYQPQSIKIFKL